MTNDNLMGYRLGADIGGTFTDLVIAAPDGGYWTKKLSSTQDDLSRGIIEGMGQLLSEQDVAFESIEEIVHGTTVATNAILQDKGAKTALITTEGFRDVLELRRMRVPSLYSLLYAPPKPLVERHLRLEVTERVGADGEVLIPLDMDSLHEAISVIREEGAEAVAVCFLHSYRYPGHERAVGDELRRMLPGVFVSLSVDVLPEIREYERTSTTVVNACLGPIVKSYTDSLVRRVKDASSDAPVRIMQSNGGIMSARRAAQTPVQMLESGPAAGVIAADNLGKRLGLKNIITFDMGGTTAKAALFENGSPSYTTDYEIGAGISLSSKLVTGGGHAVKVPVIDLAEVGAGGGSIVRIDAGGALKVGPNSAGSYPGPACYDTGGAEPTVTDANLVLGYINPSYLAGGEVKLTPSLAESSMQSAVAEPLGLSLLDAAQGVHAVANVNMIRAIRAVSTYRGRDPRDFALLAFGGSGPIHAADMARSLGIGTVVVPPSPGLFSAVGLLQARPERHFVRTYFTNVADADFEGINRVFQEFVDRSTALNGRGGLRYRRHRMAEGRRLPLHRPGPRADHPHVRSIARRCSAQRSRLIVPPRARPDLRPQGRGRADRDRQSPAHGHMSTERLRAYSLLSRPRNRRRSPAQCLLRPWRRHTGNGGHRPSGPVQLHDGRASHRRGVRRHHRRSARLLRPPGRVEQHRHRHGAGLDDMELDLIIRGGTVVDGSGSPRRTADVGITGDNVEIIGALGDIPGKDEIDAEGLVVAPGFVDIHSHSDFTLLVDPRAQSSVYQGVTTELVGNCGHGCAPITDPHLFTGNILRIRPRYRDDVANVLRIPRRRSTPHAPRSTSLLSSPMAICASPSWASTSVPPLPTRSSR